METSLEQQSQRPLPASTTPRLLSLPPEIRLEIFSLCIPTKRAIRVTNERYRPYGVEPLVSTRDPSDRFSNTRPRWTNILHVSKQMSNECLDILYGDNLFEIYLNKGGEATLKKTFSRANLKRIQFILAISPGPCFTGELKPPDNNFWAMVIPNLKLFEWVAQPDLKAERNRSNLMVEEGLESWRKWTDSYSDCFAEFLVPGLDFKMVAGNGDDKYRKIGRLRFRRGPFFKKIILWEP
ncbi:uncharacterized protein PGRI_022770 [Penicillium griseofulvum]|uniref:2EXR domain-containing protein n=1 Tax=Penicillium patulum TaxID=5078 RepID=A0A135LHG1_PENPA|nr:uncharacterized protein PGRI_022770 [Penicillium griseofulvum]KXG48407.1 hypothetical protein PGRI_022770 [Penicillium griseofulvum]